MRFSLSTKKGKQSISTNSLSRIYVWIYQRGTSLKMQAK
jgi:hypothetical protein